MNIYSNRLPSTLDEITTGEIAPSDVDLLIIHGPPLSIEDTFFLDKLNEHVPNAEIIGCSSIGEFINDEAEENTIVYSAIDFQKTSIKSARFIRSGSDLNDYEVGEVLSKELTDEKLKCVILFFDVFAVDSDDFIKGLESHLPSGVALLGGAAADNFEFERSIVMDKEGVYENGMVAVGLYGDALQVNSRSSYFDQDGEYVNITKVDENKVYELNGRPAAEVYKELLGERVTELPTIAALFPFIFLDEDDTPLYCRKVIEVIEEENALLFSLPMPQGRFKVANLVAEDDMLLKDARRTAEGVRDPKNEFAYVISCCARREDAGALTSDECKAVYEGLDECPFIGFYSFGEIGRSSNDAENIVNNVTVTIGTFYEA